MDIYISHDVFGKIHYSLNFGNWHVKHSQCHHQAIFSNFRLSPQKKNKQTVLIGGRGEDSGSGFSRRLTGTDMCIPTGRSWSRIPMNWVKACAFPSSLFTLVDLEYIDSRSQRLRTKQTGVEVMKWLWRWDDIFVRLIIYDCIKGNTRVVPCVADEYSCLTMIVLRSYLFD